MSRSYSSFFERHQLDPMLNGVMSYRYRDVPCHKSPIDIAIYIQLIGQTKPATIIELGTKYGGSAMLFRDLSSMMNLHTRIVSIDQNLPEKAEEFKDILFIEGNVSNLEDLFEQHALHRLPRPWLVIEDSAHTFSICTEVLEYFSHQLRSGEYLVMEDGVLEEMGIARRYDGGPNRAIREFLLSKPDQFKIDEFYCDMFGANATFNPNGYLKKT